jgi:hypothetical protein
VVLVFKKGGGCLRLVITSQSPIELQKNLLRNVLRGVEILSKGWC